MLKSLDDRKKLNLIDAIRDRGGSKTQHIITAVDSELSVLPNGTTFSFEETEMILHLHDEGREVRLFKMDQS